MAAELTAGVENDNDHTTTGSHIEIGSTGRRKTQTAANRDGALLGERDDGRRPAGSSRAGQ